jgi:predicted DNA-binding protein (MmcQ/YjbR family)
VERVQRLRVRVRDHALTLPEAHEEFPWGDRVVKVRGKIFVFLGADEPDPRYPTGIGVKLTTNHPVGMALPGATPSGYGLGKAGWVSIPFGEELPPWELLRDLVEESYRAVAPKSLVKALDPR